MPGERRSLWASALSAIPGWLLCGILPDWHQGFVSIEVTDPAKWEAGVVYATTPRRHGGLRSRVWTIGECPRCGDAEF